jgi:hypothetical protein
MKEVSRDQLIRARSKRNKRLAFKTPWLIAINFLVRRFLLHRTARRRLPNWFSGHVPNLCDPPPIVATRRPRRTSRFRAEAWTHHASTQSHLVSVAKPWKDHGTMRHRSSKKSSSRGRQDVAKPLSRSVRRPVSR